MKGGITYGTTDDFGYKVVDKPVHIHDLHATILHLMGLDHEKLTYRYSGRDFRLTDVHGAIIKDILRLSTSKGKSRNSRSPWTLSTQAKIPCRHYRGDMLPRFPALALLAV